MGVRSEVDALIESLGDDLSPHGRVLAETATALADNVDSPPLTLQGSVTSIAPYANALRATVAELVAKGRASVDVDEAADGWAAIAAQHGATPIRDTSQPDAPDIRRRGGRGRQAAP